MDALHVCAAKAAIQPEDLPRREVSGKPRVFRQLTDTTQDRPVTNGFAKESYFAGVGTRDGERDLNKRGLAGAIRAQKTKGATGVHRKIHVLQRTDFTPGPPSAKRLCQTDRFKSDRHKADYRFSEEFAFEFLGYKRSGKPLLVTVLPVVNGAATRLAG